MSELNGVFLLRSPADLLAKLEADHARLVSAEPCSMEAQYAAFDFFVTAEHLADWMQRARGGTLAAHKRYADGAVVSHLANGAKHFRVDRHEAVRDTRILPGTKYGGAKYGASKYGASALVIDLENGTVLPVLILAQRVLDHWRATVV